MKQYILILLGFGLATVLMVYIQMLTKKLKINFALPMLLLGVLLFYLGIPVDWPDSVWEHKWVKIVTELIVVISLMGAGLKIGFRYGKKHWKNPLRLIHTTMPIYILGIFLLGYYFLELNGAAALLLAAVCAPTDPVMASDMQLENDEMKDSRNTGLRYLLTAEAGLNDGMAFPFVYLAILWSNNPSFNEINIGEWLSFYLLFKICFGILIGSIFGFVYSWSLKKLGKRDQRIALSGFIGIAIAIASFAIAETASSYGFLSAFFTGIFAQYHNHKEMKNHSKTEMLLYTEETEKFLIIVWVMLFGGFLANGILRYSSSNGIIAAFLIIMVLRPFYRNAGYVHDKFRHPKKVGYQLFWH